MNISGRMSTQLLLFSLVIVVVPMVLFPERLGMNLAKASFLSAGIELAFYGFVVYWFHRRTNLMRLIQAAGLCLVYRLGVGAVFGLFIALMYSMNLKVSMSLGLSGYLPAIFLHIALTPFILRPWIKEILAESDRREKRTTETPAVTSTPERAQAAPAAAPRATAPLRNFDPAPRPRVSASRNSATPGPGEVNGFDKATSYIGEHSAVLVAAVVDLEGLLLSSFSRQGCIPEDWAPFALIFRDQNEDILTRFQSHSPRRIDIVAGDKRIVVAYEEHLSLMVVADYHTDDLVSIRINQALDMIKKYVTDRYGAEPVVNAEKEYVPGT